MIPGILKKIVDDRRSIIAEMGYSMGAPVPEERIAQPPVPFIRQPLIICEVKRRSPSRGAIRADLDPVSQARHYAGAGVGSVSVLTEQNHFSGSLEDLMAVKQALPDLAVLRKDFLIEPEDVEIAYRAGADAVLLIAAILSPAKLAELHEKAISLGLTALVEIHNLEELETVRESGVQPELMGINARNLNTFQVDLLAPLRLCREIDWNCTRVFESGIFSPSQIPLIQSAGFSGVLVGEAVVRDISLAGALASAFTDTAGDVADLSQQTDGAGGVRFWEYINQCITRGTPLVKICGITNVDDAALAIELGADLIGCVFADSPRQVDAANVPEIAELCRTRGIPLVAVVTHEPDATLRHLYEAGDISVFQFHGSEGPTECTARELPYFKALGITATEEIAAIMDFPVPRVLVDAKVGGRSGGTGVQLDEELAALAAGQKPLWLAGGLNDTNIRRVVEALRPELVDASSGLETSPGKKSREKMEMFFKELRNATVQ